jgi:diaminohydroxyphosphoribosylaminopyrimidine deaminase/5-amino-6-(5-phosphoribosylamino)uracil reductase
MQYIEHFDGPDAPQATRRGVTTPDAVAHEAAMRVAIAEAELARGTTGNNPWVGCSIADANGVVIARGHTQGPGEDHAEIVALRHVRARGIDLSGLTLYSTLEPCSFHGRTPACSHAIVASGVRRIVTGIRDPNPRVDGLGIQILRAGGLDVIEDVCAREITHQLGAWIFHHHPHEPLRRARAWFVELDRSHEATLQRACDHYGVDRALVEPLLTEQTLSQHP